MLHIFIFVPTSLPPHLPISPPINQVESMAMSNIGGFTPDHLLQQIYGTTVLDEHVDVELSDEELELIAGRPRHASGYTSDLFVNDRKIIDFRSDVQQYVTRNDHQGLINHIMGRFGNSGIPITPLVAGVISDNLRATAPILIKREHRGFKVNLDNGQVCYNDTPCPF